MLLRRGLLGNNNPLKYRVMQETRAIRASALASTPLGGRQGGEEGINKYRSPAKSLHSAVLSSNDGSLHLGA